jgi:DinB superfamily
MTDETPNILEQLEREWLELGAGIRQQKLEELFMRVVEVAETLLTESERAEAIAIHDQTDRDFIAAIEGLNQAQWTFKPGARRWSIQEIAEHITLVAAMGTAGVEKALAQEFDPNVQEPAGMFEAMKLRVMDRSSRGIQAPEPVSPRGMWSIEVTVQRFRQIRSIARALLEQRDAPLKSRAFALMPGTYNCYHWLILTSLHTRRHLAQIAEVKATERSEGFPS